VTAPCNGVSTVIQGEIDVRCEPWNGSAWTGSAWTGSAWTGSAWTGSAWTGSAWTSAVYDDFLTAFWGNKAPWWKHVAGEVSEPRPGFAEAP